MDFKINDFLVRTEKKEEESYQKIFDKSSNRNIDSNYKWQKKIREFTVFNILAIRSKKDNQYNKIISNLFNFIDFIEILKAFNNNKLNADKEYQIGNSLIAKIATRTTKTTKTTDKKEEISLSIHFIYLPDILYFDKFECSSLAAKFSKILSRCEAWQE